jgi:hypothetical protein
VPVAKRKLLGLRLELCRLTLALELLCVFVLFLSNLQGHSLDLGPVGKKRPKFSQ